MTDGAGGLTTDTFVLTVTPPATLVGIQNVPPPANRQFNRGSTIPMVWEYRVGSTMVDSALVRQTVSITGPTEDPQIIQTYSCTNQTAATPCTDSGSSFFRYDASTRRWSFNLQTKTPAGIRLPGRHLHRDHHLADTRVPRHAAAAGPADHGQAQVAGPQRVAAGPPERAPGRKL